jgi:predicted metal-dependent hydrolase
MSELRVTPAMIEAAYNLMKTTAPFNRWKLPDSEDVEFCVTKHKDRLGDCVDAGHAFVLRVSERFHGRLDALLTTVAHEMVHIRQSHYPAERDHGPTFKRLAKQVCKHHPHIDPKTF